MADLTITVPDPQVQRILDAYEVKLGRPATAEDVRQDLIRHLQATVVRTERQALVDQAIVPPDAS